MADITTIRPHSVEPLQPLGDTGERAVPLLRLWRVLLRVVPAAFLLSAVLGWVGTVRTPGGFDKMVRQADFISNLTGAQVLHNGNGLNLYDLSVQHAAQVGLMQPYIALAPGDLLPYNHLPFEALFTTPLIGILPATAIFLLWDVAMLAALALFFRVMQRTLPLPGGVLLFSILAFVSYGPVTRTFLLGQDTPLVLLGLCLVYALCKRNMDAWAGVALVLVALKPQILPVICLLLLLQGRWRTLVLFAGVLLGLCVGVMPVLGIGWPWQYAQLLLGVANWQNAGAIDPSIMHNWRGFATNLLSGWAPGLITPSFLLLTLLSSALLVWVWYRTRGNGNGNAPATQSAQAIALVLSYDLLWAVAGVIAVLTSLHLNPHDLMLLLFPAWIVAAYAFSRLWAARASVLWMAILWAGYLLYQATMPLAANLGNWVVVVPSVLFMAFAAILLSRQATMLIRR